MKFANITRAIVTSLVLSLAVAGTGLGAEKEKTHEKEKSEGKLSPMEKSFIEMVALHNASEIKLAKLAEEKGTTEQVKQFAAKVIEDHTKLGTDLKQLAKEKDLELKEELPAPKRAMLEEITSKSGAEFDKAYMDHELAGHRIALAFFQNAAQFAKDPELKQFAEKYLPIIEQHGSMLEKQGQKTTLQPGTKPSGETAGARGTQPSTTGEKPQPDQPAGQVRTE